ncbi:hypothetical protein [Oceanobacillus kapialis]
MVDRKAFMVDRIEPVVDRTAHLVDRKHPRSIEQLTWLIKNKYR